MKKIKSYKELKNESWFVEDMKIYCGREVEIVHEVDENFVLLSGCSDWQWARDSFVDI